MRWAIVYNAQVYFGPSSWVNETLSQALQTINRSVSLPRTEPQERIDIDEMVSIRPVADVQVSVSVTQKVIGETVEIINDIVTSTPIVVDKTQDEISNNPYMRIMRTERDRRITEIYWRVERNITQTSRNITPDDDSTKMNEIYDYLQALRDMPDDHPNIDTKEKYDGLVWPTRPS